MLRDDLRQRYQLLHGSDSEAARAELARVKASGREVVVVSACLCGLAVAAVQTLIARFGVPRPAITLSADGKQAFDARGRDVTAALDAGARLAELYVSEAGATRALLKERSPSCGVAQVHGPDGLRAGEGRFTARLRKRSLPVVSESGPT
jgi:uncharacterized protein YbbK (DUF523 family)